MSSKRLKLSLAGGYSASSSTSSHKTDMSVCSFSRLHVASCTCSGQGVPLGVLAKVCRPCAGYLVGQGGRCSAASQPARCSMCCQGRRLRERRNGDMQRRVLPGEGGPGHWHHCQRLRQWRPPHGRVGSGSPLLLSGVDAACKQTVASATYLLESTGKPSGLQKRKHLITARKTAL